jgi:BirA family biotin operon repressor/biotin-[acetyl-CoA-carboxylase] ligase
MGDLLSINAEKVLKILKKRKGRFSSTQKIATSTGLSRFNIYQSIYHLQSWGYQIESQKGKGYCLKEITDLLLPFEIKDGLKTKILGQQVHSYQTVKSTNLLAYKLAEAGSPEGTMIISEKQTAGRGRMGRDWFSPSKVGLWMSLILKPDIPPSKVAGLSVCAGLALAQTIESLFGLETKIKWPNDCLIDHKKLAGILLELSAEIDQIRFVIMGLGINVNQKRSDFPLALQDKATSIRIELSEKVSRLEILKSFLERFEKIYLVFRKKGLGAYRQEIKRCSSVLNKEVKIKFGDEIITGKAWDIDDNGSLLVKTKEGTKTVVAGEVSLL